MLVIPEGFAHGFQVLEPDSELLYLHTAFYEPAAEGGVAPEDPAHGIRLAFAGHGFVAARPVAIRPLPTRFRGIAVMNCRHCAHGAGTWVSRSRLRPAFECLPGARGAQRTGNLLSTASSTSARNCWLVQTEDYAAVEELFSADYAYFSSVSQQLAGTMRPATAPMITRAPRPRARKLRHRGGFQRRLSAAGTSSRPGFPVSASSPPRAPPRPPKAIGIPITARVLWRSDWRTAWPREGKAADLILGNNVYAHVPDINDFTAGLQRRAQARGHDHARISAPDAAHRADPVRHGVPRTFLLSVADTVRPHIRRGRTARVRRRRTAARTAAACASTDATRDDARAAGRGGAHECWPTKQRRGLQRARDLSGLSGARRSDQGRARRFSHRAEARRASSVAAYGAAAKGNTLLNYAGVKPDLLPFVAMRRRRSRANFSRAVTCRSWRPTALRERRPDIVLILPWNIAEEVVREHQYIRDWGGRFVVAVPELKFLT